MKWLLLMMLIYPNGIIEHSAIQWFPTEQACEEFQDNITTKLVASGVEVVVSECKKSAEVQAKKKALDSEMDANG